jgi:hypothetical protein
MGQAEPDDGVLDINADESAPLHFIGCAQGAVMRFTDQVFFPDRAFIGADQVEAVGRPVAHERCVSAEGCVCCIHKAFLVFADQIKQTKGNHNQGESGSLSQAEAEKTLA